MGFKKYRNPLLLLIFFLVLIAVSWVYIYLTEPEPSGFISLIPIDHGIIQIEILLLVSCLAAIIGGNLGGYILGPIFLWSHKLKNGKNVNYGIQNVPEPKKFGDTLRGFDASLLAFTIGMELSKLDFIFDFLGLDIVASSFLAPILRLFILMPFTVLASTLLYSPVWNIYDSGIVYSNKYYVRNKRDAEEIFSVGNGYMRALNGFAKISTFLVLLSYLNYLITTLTPDIYNIITFISIPLSPIYITILIIPSAIILEMTSSRRVYQTRIFAEKRLSIFHYMEIEFKEMQETPVFDHTFWKKSFVAKDLKKDEIWAAITKWLNDIGAETNHIPLLTNVDKKYEKKKQKYLDELNEKLNQSKTRDGTLQGLHEEDIPFKAYFFVDFQVKQGQSKGADLVSTDKKIGIKFKENRNKTMSVVIQLHFGNFDRVELNILGGKLNGDAFFKKSEEKWTEFCKPLLQKIAQ
jgi:hypothetical protein